MKVESYIMIYDLRNKHQNNAFAKSRNRAKEKMKDSNEIQILGKEFVENNGNKGKLIIKNKKIHLKEFYENIDNEKDIIKIKMNLDKNICNKSYMFKKCYLLSEFMIKDPSNFDTRYSDTIEISNSKKNEKTESDYNYANLKGMFFGCLNLKYLPANFKLIYKNILNMKDMFYNCFSLEYLLDISEWNTENVIDMSGMFCGCQSLKTLPDISKWNTNRVNYMSKMFSECWILSSLPNISKWNTINVYDMSSMFNECRALYSLNLSDWNTSNVIDMNNMFKQ